MGDADAGTIKAKVVIEYDGEGLEKAKEDLASLGDVGGTAEGGISGANEALAQFEEQAGKSAGSAKTFSEALNDLPKVTEGGTAAVSDLTDAMAEQQGVIEDTVESLGNIQEPLKAYNEGLQTVSDTVSSPHFTENMSAFQDALENPYPFQMIGQHLTETGQTWEDFTSSIGENNTAMLHEMASNADTTYQVLGGMSEDIQNVRKSAADGIDWGIVGPPVDWSTGVKDATESLSGFNKEINAFGGVGEMLYGPEKAGASLGEILGGAMSDLGGVLGSVSEWVMPLMAFQMVVPVVMQLGQGIYDAAAIAEGPAAHSMGTFTGSVDALGQTAQKSAGQFAESFGRQIIPTLDAVNQQMSQSGSTSDQLGGWLGGAVSLVANVGEVIGGLATMTVPGGAGLGGSLIASGGKGLVNQFEDWFGIPESFQGPGPVAQAQINYQQQMAALPTTVQGQVYQLRTQSAITLADAIDPDYLAAQDKLTASQRLATRLQASYDASNPENDAKLLADARYDQYVARQQAIQVTAASQPGALVSGDWGQVGQNWNDIMGGIGNWLGGAGNWLTNLFGGGGAPTSSTAGCFPAGTRIHMADDTDKAIEDVRVGEKIIGHDGLDEVIVNVTALITPPPRQVYTLTFAHGTTLTVTDSHPIATPLEGWKALSVEHAKQENPDLPISELRIGDHVLLSYGAYPLVSIVRGDVVPVYNITVDGAHTFYANNVLVHNKVALGQQIGDQVQGIQLPKLDLSAMAAGLSASFSGIQLPHLDLSGINASLSGALSGIQMPHLDLSSITSSLAGAFSGIQIPSLPDIGSRIGGELAGMFSGIQLPAIPDFGARLSGELAGMFAGIGIPSVPNIGAMLTGAMDGIFSGIQLPTIPQLGAMLTGAMSGMFAGIQLPQIPNIGAMLSGAMSVMLGGASSAIPGFAGGVSDFAGGAAFIAEGGPELVTLPQGASVYPLSTGAAVGGNMTPISLGGGGGNAPQSANIFLQIDGQTFWSATGISLSQSTRVMSGMRSY